jgi:hypothetical protein
MGGARRIGGMITTARMSDRLVLVLDGSRLTNLELFPANCTIPLREGPVVVTQNELLG